MLTFVSLFHVPFAHRPSSIARIQIPAIASILWRIASKRTLSPQSTGGAIQQYDSFVHICTSSNCSMNLPFGCSAASSVGRIAGGQGALAFLVSAMFVCGVVRAPQSCGRIVFPSMHWWWMYLRQCASIVVSCGKRCGAKCVVVIECGSFVVECHGKPYMFQSEITKQGQTFRLSKCEREREKAWGKEKKMEKKKEIRIRDLEWVFRCRVCVVMGANRV